MRIPILICLIILSNPVLLRALTAEASLNLLPVPEEAVRAEIRTASSDGTLLAGNLQFPPNQDGLIVSQPVYWLKGASGWMLEEIPGLSPTGGFYTFSAMNAGSEFWLAGRAWSGTKVEGYAYNYASGETVWAGQLEPGLTSPIASRFTGVSDDGNLFCGNANREGALAAPVIYDLSSGQGLQEVPVAEGYEGGWLYALAGSGEDTVGIGFLYRTNSETQFPDSFPARWSRLDGLVPMDALFDGGTGTVLAISDDGSMGFGLAVADDGVQYPTVWYLQENGRAEALPLPDAPGYQYGEASSVDPISGWISGSVYYDENPDDGVPGDFRAIIWDNERNTRLASDYLSSRYRIDFTSGNLRALNWVNGGGSLFGAFRDEQEEVLSYSVVLRARAAGFEFLDPMPGGEYYAEARGISDDGKTVAGLASGYPSGSISAVWTEETGWQHLGAPEGTIFTPFFLTAADITPDGSVIVGRNPSDTGNPVGFIRDSIKSTTTFHRLSDGPVAFSRLTGVSADGKVAVGQSLSPGGGLHAFVVRDGVSEQLSYPGNAVSSWAYDVTADGLTAAGWYTNGNGSGRPVTWDLSSGNYTELPLPAGSLGADILAVSGDGSVVAGSAYFDIGGSIKPLPVYWNADREPVLIPDLGEFRIGSAWGVVNDGSMIVGQMLDEGFTGSRGFIHQTGGSTRDIHQFYLEELNVYLDREYIPGVIRVSSNGRWFCGSGPDPNSIGSSLGFRIKVPEQTAQDSFGSDSTAIGETGFVETWFGLVKDEAYPLVHHQEHGWLEMSVWGADGGYYFDTVFGWMFVDRATYPLMRFMPEGGTSKWIYYEKGSVKPRLFYDYDSATWKTEGQLVSGF